MRRRPQRRVVAHPGIEDLPVNVHEEHGDHWDHNPGFPDRFPGQCGPDCGAWGRSWVRSCEQSESSVALRSVTTRRQGDQQSTEGRREGTDDGTVEWIGNCDGEGARTGNVVHVVPAVGRDHGLDRRHQHVPVLDHRVAGLGDRVRVGEIREAREVVRSVCGKEPGKRGAVHPGRHRLDRAVPGELLGDRDGLWHQRRRGAVASDERRVVEGVGIEDRAVGVLEEERDGRGRHEVQVFCSDPVDRPPERGAELGVPAHDLRGGVTGASGQRGARVGVLAVRVAVVAVMGVSPRR